MHISLCGKDYILTSSFEGRDSERLVRLVDKFVDLDLHTKAAHGYIPDRTNNEACMQLIDAGNMMCAWHGDELAGFYLSDHWRFTYPSTKFAYFMEILQRVARKNGLNVDSIACGAQCVIDIPHQGTGLRSRLLTELVKHTAEKFPWQFSKISRDNIRANRGHTRDGWTEVAGDDEYVYVLLDTFARRGGMES